MEPTTLLLIGIVGAFFSGLLGIGGAIILVPLLLYLPPMVGLHGYRMGEIAGMTIIQVLVASAIGFLAHRKAGHLDGRIALPMGISTAVASGVGGWLSGRVGDGAIQGLFAVLSIMAALLMVLPAQERSQGDEHGSHTGLAVLLAGGVGVASGMVGAGGAFLLAPIMRTVLRLPIRLVIGMSLAVVLVSALSGAIGKAIAGQIPWAAATFLVMGSVVGSPLGAKLSHRMPSQALRWLLAVVILASAIKMVWTLVI